MAKPNTIFFSWQSDLRGASSRDFIEKALRAAVAEIVDGALLEVEPAVDRDTQGMPGSPNIRDTVFAKIERAGVFVADVTPINAGSDGRLTPNPNVLIELGYAVKALTWSRIILVLNTAHGRVEDLPFDIRGHRCTQYHSSEDAKERAPERKKLQGDLRKAVIAAFESKEPHPGVYPAELKLTYNRDGGTPERHDYKLNVALQNKGTASIGNWLIEVQIPRAILKPHVQYGSEQRTEGTETHALFRFIPKDSALNRTLYPGSTEVRSIDYHMTSALRRNADLQSQTIEGKAYMNDQPVAEVELPFGEWQDV